MKLRTSRMEISYVESGPQDGIPVVLVHGNLSTGRFYREAGGRAEIERFEGSGHFPPIDVAERRSRTFFDFLASIDR
jgi:pimeloyl-ACP methyl ester carboxylesterase